MERAASAPAAHVAVRTDDLEEAARALAGPFPGLRVDARPIEPAAFHLDYRLLGEPRFALHRVRCTGHLRAVGRIPDCVAIGRYRQRQTTPSQRQGRGAHRSFLCPTLWNEANLRQAEGMLVTLDPGALDGFAERSGERPVPARTVVADAARVAWELVMDHADRLADDRAALARPGAADEMFELLCWSVVRAFPDPWAKSGRAGSKSLRRALAHIEEHAHEAVSITEMAAAARVSPRLLHLLFRRELDTTPHRYLRELRLDRARSALLTGDDDVAVVVARQGLGHPGRFASDYRNRFGEAPATTLRAARG